MIDFKKAKATFKEYIQDYDSNDIRLKLKMTHTYHVVDYSEYIAKALKLDKENIELAKLIALLHDIARFDQAKKFAHFHDDKSYDHGNLGVEILFSTSYIREFIEDNKYDNIISKAIINHNKYKEEDNLTSEELLHTKIIRDADKLDNFRVKETESFEAIDNLSKENLENGIISDEVYNDFLAHKLLLSSKLKTELDHWMCYIAFIFDLNFYCSFVYLKEKDYVNIIFDRIDYKNKDTKKKVEKLRRSANDYIDNKIRKLGE